MFCYLLFKSHKSHVAGCGCYRGLDFRPAYRKLSAMRSIFTDSTWLGLTDTAT